MRIEDLIRAQPAPSSKGAGPAVWPLVANAVRVCDYAGLREYGAGFRHTFAELMDQRDDQGRTKYGVPLQVRNGRLPLVDAFQEFLDGCAYTRQAFEEAREHVTEENVGHVQALWDLHESCVYSAARCLALALGRCKVCDSAPCKGWESCS